MSLFVIKQSLDCSIVQRISTLCSVSPSWASSCSKVSYLATYIPLVIHLPVHAEVHFACVLQLQ